MTRLTHGAERLSVYGVRQGLGVWEAKVKFSIISAAAVVAACALAGSAQAAIGTVSAATLSSNAGHYSNIDGAGLNLNVTTTSGGSLATIGSGEFQGLWFGGNQGDAYYTLTFSKPIDYFSMSVNAMSTSPSYSEVISQFYTGPASLLNFSFTPVAYTAWDGSSITSSNGNGYFQMAITAVGGAAFNSVSFFHNQEGEPNGSVFTQIGFEQADGGGVIGGGETGGGAVPEPATWAMMILGFGLAGAALRRRPALARAA
jgi:hypothetical protein